MSEKIVTRSDIRFWIFLISAVVLIVAWGVRLQTQVEAMNIEMHEKGGNMTATVKSIESRLLEIRESQIRIEIKLGIDSQ